MFEDFSDVELQCILSKMLDDEGLAIMEEQDSEGDKRNNMRYIAQPNSQYPMGEQFPPGPSDPPEMFRPPCFL